MAEQKTVLVMEDNEKNMKLFRDLLQSRNYQVLETVNGREGVELAQKHKPDLIIMDWYMPVMNGQEATPLLKSSEATKDIPLLVVTALAMRNEVQQIKASGCDDYLTKPIDIAGFFQKVEKLLN